MEGSTWVRPGGEGRLLGEMMFTLELAGKSLLSRGDSTGKGQEVEDLRQVAAGRGRLEWQSQPVEGPGNGWGRA